MKTKTLICATLLMCSVILNAQTIMNIHQSNGTELQIPLNTIDSITYTIQNPGNLATLITLPAGNITETSAITGGNISNNGGSAITQKGIVWSVNPNPTTANNITNDGSGSGSFTTNLSGLTANTIYYLRAYANNSAGTAYGNEESFTTTDDDGEPTVSSQIFETWNMIYYQQSGNPVVNNVPCDEDLEYVFNSNGVYYKTSFSGSDNDNCDVSIVINGTWEATADNVLLLTPSSSSFATEILTLTLLSNNQQLEVERPSNLVQVYQKI